MKETENIIDLNKYRKIFELLTPSPEIDEKDKDTTKSPPQTTKAMFPNLLNEIVGACTCNSEAVPVAVAINTIIRFSAMVGPLIYYPIGDEDRVLNEFVLMVGHSGLGKGCSNFAPAKIFHRVEEFLAEELEKQFQSGKSDGIKDYPLLHVHNGGLSSGEGLAAALNDNSENNLGLQATTDKRILLLESEFSNSMNMAQRSGNVLMMILRNAYDGLTIEPLTKNNKVKVSNPYVCLIAHITAKELIFHEQLKVLANNGLLNRFLILWQQPTKSVAFPTPITESVIDDIASKLAERVLFARNYSFETHHKKLKKLSRPLSMSSEAKNFWRSKYKGLLNQANCEIVRNLTIRNRLHAVILAALFALLDMRYVIEVPDLISALEWCEYSRKSVSYIFNILEEQSYFQKIYSLSKKVLYMVYVYNNKNNICTRTDLHNGLNRNVKKEDLQKALEFLLTYVPPLIIQDFIMSENNRKIFTYRINQDAMLEMKEYLK